MLIVILWTLLWANIWESLWLTRRTTAFFPYNYLPYKPMFTVLPEAKTMRISSYCKRNINEKLWLYILVLQDFNIGFSEFRIFLPIYQSGLTKCLEIPIVNTSVFRPRRYLCFLYGGIIGNTNLNSLSVFIFKVKRVFKTIKYRQYSLKHNLTMLISVSEVINTLFKISSFPLTLASPQVFFTLKTLNHLRHTLNLNNLISTLQLSYKKKGKKNKNKNRSCFIKFREYLGVICAFSELHAKVKLVIHCISQFFLNGKIIFLNGSFGFFLIAYVYITSLPDSGHKTNDTSWWINCVLLINTLMSKELSGSRTLLTSNSNTIIN